MPHHKSKKILIYIFLFFMIGTLNNKNLKNFNFPKINKINILKINKKSNLELRSNLNFLKIKNLFFLNKIKITETINSNNLTEK